MKAKIRVPMCAIAWCFLTASQFPIISYQCAEARQSDSLAKIETDRYIIRYDPNDRERAAIARKLSSGDYLSEAYSAATNLAGKPRAGSPKIKIDLLYQNPGALGRVEVGRAADQGIKVYIDTIANKEAGGHSLGTKALDAYGSTIAHETTHKLLDRGNKWFVDPDDKQAVPTIPKSDRFVKREAPHYALLHEGLAHTVGNTKYKYDKDKEREYEASLREKMLKLRKDGRSEGWQTIGEKILKGSYDSNDITQMRAFGQFIATAGEPEDTQKLVKLVGEGKSLDEALREVYGNECGLDNMEEINNDFWFGNGELLKQMQAARASKSKTPQLGADVASPVRNPFDKLTPLDVSDLKHKEKIDEIAQKLEEEQKLKEHLAKQEEANRKYHEEQQERYNQWWQKQQQERYNEQLRQARERARKAREEMESRREETRRPSRDRPREDTPSGQDDDVWTSEFYNLPPVAQRMYKLLKKKSDEYNHRPYREDMRRYLKPQYR